MQISTISCVGGSQLKTEKLPYKIRDAQKRQIVVQFCCDIFSCLFLIMYFGRVSNGMLELDRGLTKLEQCILFFSTLVRGLFVECMAAEIEVRRVLKVLIKSSSSNSLSGQTG